MPQRNRNVINLCNNMQNEIDLHKHSLISDKCYSDKCYSDKFVILRRTITSSYSSLKQCIIMFIKPFLLFLSFLNQKYKLSIDYNSACCLQNRLLSSCIIHLKALYQLFLFIHTSVGILVFVNRKRTSFAKDGRLRFVNHK